MNDISGDVPVTKTSLPQTPSKVVSGDAGSVDLIVLPEMFTTDFVSIRRILPTLLMTERLPWYGCGACPCGMMRPLLEAWR